MIGNVVTIVNVFLSLIIETNTHREIIIKDGRRTDDNVFTDHNWEIISPVTTREIS